MLLIILFRILFYIFFSIFYGIIIYAPIKNKAGIWSFRKELFVFFVMVTSFLLAAYFMLTENGRLIKYHLKNKSYHEMCGTVVGFSGNGNISSRSRYPVNIDIQNQDDTYHYSVNHFYGYKNLDKYQIGDKVCIKYFIQFQYIYFHLPSERYILYMTKPNSTMYDNNHISLTDEYEEFR